MNAFNYEKFYEKVGAENGWDFSKVKCQTEGVAWDFYEEIIKGSHSSDLLLDLGTGGGEKVLPLAASYLLVVGIDQSKGMIQTAQTNLEETGLRNVRFLEMDEKRLQFPSNFFEQVCSRHCSFTASEVERVLKKGGVFLTQQVSEADKLNLKKAFGRGQAYGKQDGTLKHFYINELKQAGFREVEAFEYDATEYYQEDEDLLFILKNTPIIPDFGEDPKDWETFESFVEKNKTERGIRTNSKRFMIRAKK